MKALTFTLLLSFCTLLSMAYSYMGKEYSFRQRVDQGAGKFLFDCYTTEDGENEENEAILVKCNYSTTLLNKSYNIPSKVEYNGKSYIVRYIADQAFMTVNDDNIRSVDIPNTVIGIGNSAFEGCDVLARVNMGDGVQTIGNKAFYQCTALCKVVMSENVHSIGDMAFGVCWNLEGLKFPSALWSIGNLVIGDCTQIKYIEWDVKPGTFDYESLYYKLLFKSIDPKKTYFITRTREQADLMSKFSERVLCEEDKSTMASMQKTVEENNTMIENLALQYTMLQQESQVLQVHNSNLNKCDVNEDGALNSADVVTIYNNIIEGSTSYNGQYYVDLGLPSGTLWATCNVGAPSPECVGDYFAWGENGFYSYRYGLAFGKLEFTEKTYHPAPGVEDIVNGEWPQEYSPLKVIYIAQWDGWKIPNRTQARELFNYCTKKTVTINGQECVELTSRINKKKIYFPINGKISGNSVEQTDDAYYWTSTAILGNGDIMPFHLHSDRSYELNYLGLGIRPVIMKEDIGQ